MSFLCFNQTAPLSLFLMICATASTVISAQTPVSLVPQGEREKMNYAAIGVQIYECKNSDKGATWTFVAPEADLFDATGKRIGKHYAGPAWESDDGSKIVGSVKARADAQRPGAIPLLLLSAKSEAKPGVFDSITSLQRVNTLGGVAPVAGCDAGKLGQQARVYYSANYIYLTK
jgi:hypothetical protein